MGLFSKKKPEKEKTRADATAEWLYEAIILFLQGPMYTTPLMGFIDAHCLVFDGEEENKLSYTDVHQQFKDLVEKLLTGFLSDLGIVPEQFVHVVSNAAKTELNEFIITSILTVDDFTQFKAMMVKRNRDLTDEVLRRLEAAAAEASPSPSPGPGPGPPLPAGTVLGTPVSAGAGTGAGPSSRLGGGGGRQGSGREGSWTPSPPPAQRGGAPPPPSPIDDGFDVAAMQHAMELSRRQLQAEKSAAESERAAVARASKLSKKSSAREKKLPGTVAADGFDATALEAAMKLSKETHDAHQAKVTEAEAKKRAAEEAKRAAERAEADAARAEEEDLRKAMALSASALSAEAVVARREREELEAAIAASLELSEKEGGAGGGGGEIEPSALGGGGRGYASSSSFPRAGVVASGSLPPIQRAHQPAGYRSDPNVVGVDGVGRNDMAAVRAAAAAAAASQVAVVAANRERTETRLAAVSSPDPAEMDRVRRERYMEEQRRMLIAKRAAEREKELDDYTTSYVNPMYASSRPQSAAVLSEEEQNAKRAQLRNELATAMREELSGKLGSIAESGRAAER